jgi:predicted RNase H-like nuclease
VPALPAASTLIGIDLAWGDRKPDGVCAADARNGAVRITEYAYPQGDTELLAFVRARVHPTRRLLLTIDAPILCPNRTGTRPVDRLTHTMFHREHAACHPANSTKCPRPPRIRRALEKMGIPAGWDLSSSRHLAAEVYPHPAMVRLFRLERIVKYKRGGVGEKRKEFRRLQGLLRELLGREMSWVTGGEETEELLRAPWTKRTEDLTDALFCTLIGAWHWRHGGRRSEVIGNGRTGFILLPEDLRSRAGTSP